MVKVAAAVALKVTGAAQLELVVPGLSAQLVGVKLPPVGLLLKLTVPRGADFVPLSVSVTVAVQVVEPPRGISGAAQLTTVVVVRGATVTAAGAVLVAWFADQAGVLQPGPELVGAALALKKKGA